MEDTKSQTVSNKTPENLEAKDLMRRSFLRLGSEHTLREALGILLATLKRPGGPRVLSILNPDGSFAGILTTRYLLKALVPDWVREDEAVPEEIEFEQHLLTTMRDKLDLQIQDAMNRDVSTVSPTDRLPLLIEKLRDKHAGCLPVLENERLVGIIYLTDVFNAAAGLALTSKDEG